MKFVALVSGGKDSCFNILHCFHNGHELVCLANLYPPAGKNTDELDSYMYQTVGHDVLQYYSDCIGKPMYRGVINGRASNQSLEYKKTKEDETEDLYKLLKEVVDNHPEVEAVSVGAILSSYQRTRVEDVCNRLGLVSLAYLWQRDQADLMQEMCDSGMDARIVKVAAIGLDEKNLGLTLSQIHKTLLNLNKKFGVHICGEGGEFETSVFDAPFFINGRINIAKREVVRHTNDDVWYLKLKVRFEEKAKKLEIENWDKYVVEPPLLNEKFQDIYDFVSESPREIKENEMSLKSLTLNSEPGWDKNVCKVGDKIYISNLYSKKKNIEDQMVDIFRQLKESLGYYKVDFENIQSSKLLVSDISQFATINAAYTKYFTQPLPPARICVETNLPEDILAQLSVVVINDIHLKQGLHVQGRSYWAPSNIGPYSQTISSKNDRITHLSGQIPLVPKNMELCTDPKLAAIMALQHYDNVKEVTNFTKNLLTICFIKNLEFVDLATNVFNEYIEQDGGKRDNYMLLRVTGLPRGADIEWGGMAYQEDNSLNYESDDENEDTNPIEILNVKFMDSLRDCEFQEDKFYTIYTDAKNILKHDKLPKNYEICPVCTVFDIKKKQHKYGVIEQ